LETEVKQLIAHVAAIFLLRFSRNHFACFFLTNWHSIIAREGLLESYGSKKNSRRQYDVLVPLATPSDVTSGLEFGVFGQTPPKMGSSSTFTAPPVSESY